MEANNIKKNIADMCELDSQLVQISLLSCTAVILWMKLHIYT